MICTIAAWFVIQVLGIWWLYRGGTDGRLKNAYGWRLVLRALICPKVAEKKMSAEDYLALRCFRLRFWGYWLCICLLPLIMLWMVLWRQYGFS